MLCFFYSLNLSEYMIFLGNSYLAYSFTIFGAGWCTSDTLDLLLIVIWVDLSQVNSCSDSSVYCFPQSGKVVLNNRCLLPNAFLLNDDYHSFHFVQQYLTFSVENAPLNKLRMNESLKVYLWILNSRERNEHLMFLCFTISENKRRYTHNEEIFCVM